MDGIKEHCDKLEAELDALLIGRGDVQYVQFINNEDEDNDDDKQEEEEPLLNDDADAKAERSTWVMIFIF